MSGTAARNIAILVGLAVVVAFLPGGDDGAELLSQVLGAIFIVVTALILGQLYRRFRTDIYGLGERYRLVLYASIGAIAIALICASRMLQHSGSLGFALWFGLMAAGAYGLYATWRQYREYGI
ncbi:MAG: hypothetical protein JHC95_22180 [Solirubrobacteraceae bacterium]|nr:hypothetical protein [Solirubrobacteraceae bacterium]